jgi:hypothetical protein
MQRLVVTLEQVKETKGTYRFDSPDPHADVTNVYVRKSAFGATPAPVALPSSSRPPTPRLHRRDREGTSSRGCAGRQRGPSSDRTPAGRPFLGH